MRVYNLMLKNHQAGNWRVTRQKVIRRQCSVVGAGASPAPPMKRPSMRGLKTFVSRQLRSKAYLRLPAMGGRDLSFRLWSTVGMPGPAGGLQGLNDSKTRYGTEHL